MIKPERKIFKAGDLLPADYNPRKIDKKQKQGLEKSLDKFGYLQDIIVNIRDDKNIIVGGHQRLKALNLPKSEEIECTIVDLSETEEKALNIALNNKNISGEYDQEALEKILSELQDWEGFDDLNFDDLVKDFDFDFDEKNTSTNINNDEFKKGLFEKFLIPPFSILDARQGYWQERKRMWLSLGMQSELGRGGGY